MHRAAFLDRDGVIVENRDDYVKDVAEVQFLDGVFAALRHLADQPLSIVIVSNQSAIGRGLLDEDLAWKIQRWIEEQIKLHGGRVDRSYICPHHPEAGCDCRKPKPGMLYRASRELGLDLRRSWLVGDAVTDLQAAQAAGARAVLVRTGRGSEQEPQVPLEAASLWPVVPDLAAAVAYILKELDSPQHVCYNDAFQRGPGAIKFIP